MNEFKVGDTAWAPRVGQVEKEMPCPVCFGKRSVRLILGNDDVIETPCDYCGKGYEGPRGTVTEWEYVAEARMVVVTRIEQEITTSGTTTTYYDGSYVYRDLFETSEEAQAAAEERKRIDKRNEEDRADWIKKNVHKSFSWNVGYHLQCAKRAREEAARHEHKAKLCRDRIPSTSERETAKE